MRNRLLRHYFLIIGLLAACASPLSAQVRHEFIEVHMGMPVRVVLHAADDASAQAAAAAAFRCIAALEDIFSDYRAHTELRRLESHAGRWVPVSEPLFDLLQRALHVARLTGGAFDPTVGPVTALWRGARQSGGLPAPAALDSARRLTGWRLLHVDTARRAVRLERAGMRLDLGGIAKGYILDAALRSLHEHDVHAALIEAGGDIVAADPPPGRNGWRIDAPDAGPAFRARARSLARAALATSGPTFQYLERDGVRYSHIVDPRSGQALTTPRVTRVIASDAALADALATALSVDPGAAERLLRLVPGLSIELTPAARGGR